MKRLALGVAAGTAVALLAGCGTKAAPIPPRVAARNGWVGTKPAELVFSGDAGNVVTALHWTTWDATKAVGYGIWTYQTCVPNCASGENIPYPAKITLTDNVDGFFTHYVEQTSGPHHSTTQGAVNSIPSAR